MVATWLPAAFTRSAANKAHYAARMSSRPGTPFSTTCRQSPARPIDTVGDSSHRPPLFHQLIKAMSSGYGLQGGQSFENPQCRSSIQEHAKYLLLGPSRCFPFWQEVLACYVVNTNAEDDSGKKKCVPVLEDYYECLHHKKEVSIPSCLELGAAVAVADTRKIFRRPE